MTPPPPTTPTDPALQRLCEWSRPGWAASVTASASDPDDRTALEDWPRIAARARGHGLLPLIVNRWLPARSRLPVAVRADMECRQAAGLARAEYMARDASAVLRILQERGIVAVPFKGPALALRAHGDITLRSFDDLDFILHRGDIEAAAASLADRGYISCRPLPPRLLRRHIRQGWGCSLFSPDRNHRVELDSGVLHFYQEFSNPDSWLWKTLIQQPFCDSHAPGFPIEIEILLLALHGNKHLWRRLIWVADLSALLYRHPDLDGDRLLSVSRAAGARRALLLALRLSRDLHGVRLPPVVDRAIQRDRTLDSLFRAALVHLSQDRDPSRVEEIQFHLQTLDTPWNRLLYLIRQALTPSHADWSAIDLPTGLYPLYFLIRPARLLLNLVSRGSVACGA